MKQYTFFCAPCGEDFQLSGAEAGWQGDDPECPKCHFKDCEVVQDDPARRLHINLQTSQTQVADWDKEDERGAHDIPALTEAGRKKQPGFVVKDSGKREDFSTGARRDTQDGKGDFSRLPYTWLLKLAKEMQRRNEIMDRLDLVPVGPLLRLSAVFGRGCAKYDTYDDITPEKPNPIPNYQKGIPISRCISSAQRHLIHYAEGDTSEDHLAQAAWNCFAMIFMDEGVRAGRLPRELGDYGPLVNPNAKTTQATDLLTEKGAIYMKLHENMPIYMFELGKPDVNRNARDKSFTPVVVRRNGAIVKGWVNSDHVQGMVPNDK